MNVIKYLTPSILKNPNELTLEYWEIYVCGSGMEAFRGSFHKITEIHIPELELSINNEMKQLNVFQTKRDRYKAKNSDMSGKPAKFIKKVSISGEKIEILKWLEKTYKEEKAKKELLVDLFKE